jgi:hypothetical protein
MNALFMMKSPTAQTYYYTWTSWEAQSINKSFDGTVGSY